tara:strand:- start:840 stop:1061 length:222 start_codon:yes stop_codon:yes gene_type:complete
MTLQEAIEALSHHESFGVFIQTILDLREEAIESLHDASSDNIQQISGRILTYDQILQMSDWRTLQKRFGSKLN